MYQILLQDWYWRSLEDFSIAAQVKIPFYCRTDIDETKVISFQTRFWNPHTDGNMSAHTKKKIQLNAQN